MTAPVGILQFTVMIHGSRSLKEKRSVVRSLKDRLRHHHNISIAEVDALDLQNQAILGIAMIGNDAKYIRSGLSKILDQVRVHPEADLIDHTLEII